MNLWDTLGIPPTNDIQKIRAAYHAQLQRISPEEDPVGFSQLHESYTLAMRIARNTASRAVPHPAPSNPPATAQSVSFQSDLLDFSILETDNPPAPRAAQYNFPDFLQDKYAVHPPDRLPSPTLVQNAFQRLFSMLKWAAEKEQTDYVFLLTQFLSTLSPQLRILLMEQLADCDEVCSLSQPFFLAAAQVCRTLSLAGPDAARWDNLTNLFLQLYQNVKRGQTHQKAYHQGDPSPEYQRPEPGSYLSQLLEKLISLSRQNAPRREILSLLDQKFFTQAYRAPLFLSALVQLLYEGALSPTVRRVLRGYYSSQELLPFIFSQSSEEDPVSLLRLQVIWLLLPDWRKRFWAPDGADAVQSLKRCRDARQHWLLFCFLLMFCIPPFLPLFSAIIPVFLVLVASIPLFYFLPPFFLSRFFFSMQENCCAALLFFLLSLLPFRFYTIGRISIFAAFLFFALAFCYSLQNLRDAKIKFKAGKDDSFA